MNLVNTPRFATPNDWRTAGAITSIGTVGDSYDNTLAEFVVGLYKNECVKSTARSAASTTSN